MGSAQVERGNPRKFWKRRHLCWALRGAGQVERGVDSMMGSNMNHSALCWEGAARWAVGTEGSIQRSITASTFHGA